MALHPYYVALRAERLAQGVPPLRSLSVDEARRQELETVRAAARPPEPVAEVVDTPIPGPDGEVPLRIYRSRPEHAQPVLVWFYGGGWVLGTLEAADAACRRLANSTPCAVVAAAYRLAPEDPFPAAVEDCWAATRWVREHGREHGLDGSRMAVGGPSAGGNLAAATALLAREEGGPPLGLQLLVYPALEHNSDTASMRASEDPVLFDRNDVVWCWRHYLAREADGASPLASPLRARDLRGLAPALVITAEEDPLRDEAELYAERLQTAGIPTELVRFDRMAHGFFSSADVLAEAREAQELAARALRQAFAE